MQYLLPAFLLGALAGGGLAALCRAPAAAGGSPLPRPVFPALAAGNGVLWALCCLTHGLSADAALCCLLASVLLAAAFIDGRTGEIPLLCSAAALALGALRVFCAPEQWKARLIGLVAVSGPLLLLYLLSRGRAIGGGDVKLMAGCGLFLGWQQALLSFFLACVLGSVIHLLRMRLSGAERALALGPYLAAAVCCCMLWGERLLAAYLGLFS